MNNEALETLRDGVLGKRRPNHWEKRMGAMLRGAQVHNYDANSVGYKREVLEAPYCQAIIVGVHMENVVDEIQELTKCLDGSTAVLRNLVNEVTSMTNLIEPALLDSIKRARANRMALVQELRASLEQMREVRSFFLDSNYEKEMDRLERFTRLCREMLELKAAGIFDAVCDSAIRLAIKEEQ